jgi:hypothetical protein
MGKPLLSKPTGRAIAGNPVAFATGQGATQWAILANVSSALVESREDIIPRPSQLDPCVPVSVYTAPDVLSFHFCSCECNRGR